MTCYSVHADNVAEALAGGDLTSLSNQELAAFLLAAIEATTDDCAERLLFAENEICERTGIPLEETELGLTVVAVSRIDAFVFAYTGRRVEV